MLTFTNGDKCVQGNKTLTSTVFLYMECNNLDPPKQLVVSEAGIDKCQLTFHLPSRYSCPTKKPTLPFLPYNYRGTVEYSITEHNETFWVHEAYDERLGRVRYDQYLHPGGFITNLIDFPNGKRYNIFNGSFCSVSHVTPGMLQTSVFDLMREHATMVKYQGIEYHRGIPCDVWEGDWTMWSPRAKEVVKEYARWYFAKAGWVLIEDPTLVRRPVAAVMMSNRSLHTATVSYELHYISFINFNDDNDGWTDREVMLDWRWNCPGGPPAPPKPVPADDDMGMSAGGVAGLSIFLLVLGGAIGFGGHHYWLKRKMSYDSIQEHGKESNEMGGAY